MVQKKFMRLNQHNQKFQSTAGSAVFFQRSSFIKIQCVCRVHRTSASGHWIWRYISKSHLGFLVRVAQAWDEAQTFSHFLSWHRHHSVVDWKIWVGGSRAIVYRTYFVPGKFDIVVLSSSVCLRNKLVKQRSENCLNFHSLHRTTPEFSGVVEMLCYSKSI